VTSPASCRVRRLELVRRLNPVEGLDRHALVQPPSPVGPIMTQLALVAQSFTDRFADGYKRTAEGIVIMATVVTEVRDSYGYQVYTSWLDAKFGLKTSMAKNLLAIHKNLLTPNFGLEIDRANFAPSALYALGAPSVEAGDQPCPSRTWLRQASVVAVSGVRQSLQQEVGLSRVRPSHRPRILRL
jgi:hypothetical protein